MAIPMTARSGVAGHGYQAHVGPMRPTSVGRVKLRSPPIPATSPAIQFNYMQTERRPPGDARRASG